MRDVLPTGAVRLSGLFLLVVVAGCNTRDVASGIGVLPGRDAGADGPSPDGWVLPDAPSGQTDGGTTPDACTLVTCSSSGLQFCGRIGDGCGGVQECGGCSNGQTCGSHGTANVCPPTPGACTAITCVPAGGGRYCGKIGDGCGGTLTCGDCPAGEVCGGTGVPGVCGVPPPSSCQKLTDCAAPGGRLCGRVGDTCGGALECGACPSGQECGGAGIPGVCGVPPASCTNRLECTPPGGRLCGRVGDSCGGVLECGDCTDGQVCGVMTAGLCGPAPGTCTARTCNVTGGPLCGTVGDGCGGTLPCGDCPAGMTCGAGGRPGVCAPTPGTCTRIACDHMGGRYCGTIGDGCGGQLECGDTCPTGQTCGGGGAAGVCGSMGGTGGPCTNLECNRVTCPNNGKTTISGTVYAPEGTLPLYGAIVYINNEPVTPFPPGAACERCTDSLSGKPIATALTDTAGRFVLENVPVGNNIPLVIQVGRWRRQITVPTVAACADTAVDRTLTRLPRNKTEGDIPQMALTTGGADPLECLLRKIGLQDSEFTNSDGDGRVHLYNGLDGTSSFDGGDDLNEATELWDTLDSLRQYDVVLLACEGNGQRFDNKSDEARDALVAYTALGGRVFASHWHNAWLSPAASPWTNTATWNLGGRDLRIPTVATIDTSFPKGAALADWLVNVGGSTTRGQISINEAQHTVDTNNSVYSQAWIYAKNVPDNQGTNVPDTTQYFSFNTPIGRPEAEQCGRVVYSDIHVSSGDRINRPFPTGCITTALSPQEKVLIYMLFDIAACIRSDSSPPVVLPPPPPPPPSAPPAAPPASPPAPPPAAPPAPPPVAPPPPPVPPPPPPVVIN
jgi:hypothetical protein